MYINLFSHILILIKSLKNGPHKTNECSIDHIEDYYGETIEYKINKYI